MSELLHDSQSAVFNEESVFLLLYFLGMGEKNYSLIFHDSLLNETHELIKRIIPH